MTQVADSTVSVAIVGPITPPHDRSPESIDAFIDMLHTTMEHTLARIRGLDEPSEGHVDATAIGAD
jgi:hypothetical protein